MIFDVRTRPLVIGHRGASADAPDNTLAAFRLAVDQGADGVEIDVRRTSDGELILHHEPGVHDLGVFVECDLASIRKHDPSIPTLDEAAAELGSLFINLEIKNDPRQPDHDPDQGIARRVAAWVAEHGRHDQVMVSSFNADTVDAVRAADSRIATGQLLDRFAHVFQELPRVAARGHGWLVAHKSLVRTRGSELVAAAHESDVLVAVWTVDSPKALTRMGKAGVDAVITNDPRKALEVYAAG